MRAASSTFALFAILISSTAFAQSVQSSDDIVKFFSGAVDLGAKRGICVGTEDECKSKPVEPVKTGLDMLINFDLNSSDLTPDARAKLTEFAKALQGQSPALAQLPRRRLYGRIGLGRHTMKACRSAAPSR